MSESMNDSGVLASAILVDDQRQSNR